jgi:hypothetical protein
MKVFHPGERTLVLPELGADGKDCHDINRLIVETQPALQTQAGLAFTILNQENNSATQAVATHG